MADAEWLKRNPNWRRRMSTPICGSMLACDGATLHAESRDLGACAACRKKAAAKERPPKPLKGAKAPRREDVS